MLLSLAILVSGFYTAAGQVGVDTSDPESTAILELVRNKYESYSSLDVSFQLNIEAPEQPTQTIEGTFCEQGDKYRLSLSGQDIYCDGSYIWVHIKEDNEVQVNDYFADEEEGFASPKDFLQVYNKKEFIHALVGTGREDGKAIHQIEFKPIAGNSEYSKIRTSIDQGSNDIVSVKIFEKSGVRYTLDVSSLKSNEAYPSDHFTFPIQEYPDITIEDLRID